MTDLSREDQDALAEFAAGVRPWPEWDRWFGMRAARLARSLPRQRLRQLKEGPEGIVAFLSVDGVTIRPAEALNEAPDEPIAADEYEVFTAACRSDGVFRFEQADTVFDHLTDFDRFDHQRLRGRLEYDADRREYRLRRMRLDEYADSPLFQWLSPRPEMSERFDALNQRRWPLEKRFLAGPSYVLASELPPREQYRARHSVRLSRVGFSKDRSIALVYISASVCAYHLVYQKAPSGWSLAAQHIAWVV